VWNAAEGIYAAIIGGQTIAVVPLPENLTGPLSPDCEATVFAMIGNLYAAIAATPPPASSSNNPYENASGVANPTPAAAPSIQLVGVNVDTTTLSVPAPNAPFGLPNPAVFSKNASPQNLTSFPAIIGGTIIGRTTGATLPHFMLAIGIDPTGQYIIANDPLTGKQVEIYRSRPQAGQVYGVITSTGNVTPTSDQGFQAVGFVRVQL
jgi:hypothetical protein